MRSDKAAVWGRMVMAKRGGPDKQLQCISRLLAEPCMIHAGRLPSKEFDWSYPPKKPDMPETSTPTISARWPMDSARVRPQANVVYMTAAHHANAWVHQAKTPLLRGHPISGPSLPRYLRLMVTV